MGRHDPDGRPPVEILGADLGIGSTQHVAMGPHRPKPGRHRPIVIAVVVLAVLGVGLLLTERETDAERAEREERDVSERAEREETTTSTTERPTTTSRPTTTTTALVVGPPLGQPVEGALLFYLGATWQVVDLTTGAVSDIDLPQTDVYSAVSLAGGIVVPSGGDASFYPVLGAGEDPEPVVLGPADQVLRAGGERVWLVDAPSEGDDDPTPHVAVRLVDLRGTVLRSFDVPGRWVSEGTAENVLVGRGGRVYVADEAGVRAIATGWLVGTNGDAAVVQTCDDAGTCSLSRYPTDGGRARELLAISDPDATYHEVYEGPDGRTVLLTSSEYGGGGTVLTFLSVVGRSLGTYDPDLGGEFGSAPQWLPGDLGLVLPTGGGIDWIRPDGDGWSAAPIESLDRFNPESVFVVIP